MKEENIYTPQKARIEAIVPKTYDVLLFKVPVPPGTVYRPGQFFMVSVWGSGEIPISVGSHIKYSEMLHLYIRKVGFVSSAIHALRKGDDLWIRGPYGNGFPLDPAKRKEIIIVAGGIAMAPLRPLLYEFADGSGDYGKVGLIYGSRRPLDAVFAGEVEIYRRMGIDVTVTVDGKNGKWEGNVGLVTDYLGGIDADFKSAVAYVCGPEIMIRKVCRDLERMGMPPERIITTLEAHMKCGVGKCGHCYAGCKYICTDGPVFSYKEIKEYQLL